MKYLVMTTGLAIKNVVDVDTTWFKLPLDNGFEEAAALVLIAKIDQMDTFPGDGAAKIERDERKKRQIAHLFGKGIFVTVVAHGEVSMAIVEEVA